MISRLNGKLISKTATEVIIDCGGVGFSAYISLSTYDKLPAVDENVEIKTHMIFRDDGLTLYGFIDESEREAFKQLISISGVGPKIAMAVLSSLSVAELQQHILTGNAIALQKQQGIGKKTAERIILELKDKITKLKVDDITVNKDDSNIIRNEAVMALVALGYSQMAAEKSVKKVLATSTEELTVESLIRLVLKNSGK